MRSTRIGIVAVAALLLAASHTPVAAQTNADGWINQWLVFPPILREDTGANPGEDSIRLDRITDGDTIYEATMLPVETDEVEPDFGGASPALSMADLSLVGQWTMQANNADDGMDLAALYGASDNSVTYAIVYIDVEEETNARLEISSDDAVQVKIDDCEVWINNVSRGWGQPNVPQDLVGVTLSEGGHRILLKVYQGGGGYGFKLRVIDEGTAEPITSVFLDPDDVGLDSVDPVGLSMTRSVSRILIPRISEDNTVDVALSAVVTFPDIDPATAVTVTETLSAGLSYVDGSGAPAPTSVAGQTITWETTIDDLDPDGIEYQVAAEETGDLTISGALQLTEACDQSFGTTSILAKDLEGILLGDVVGGGSGVVDGDPPTFGGINIDTGLFMTFAEVDVSDGNSMDTDGINPAPVDESDIIDSVFFIQDGVDSMAIAMAHIPEENDVIYDFRPGDGHTSSWNGILSNVTHDRDKTDPEDRNFLVGGVKYATGVGVHASAGITFDLVGMRAEYGPENIEVLTGVVGMDNCGGSVNNYIIFSTEEEILPEPQFIQSATSNTGEPVRILIPEEATYMTLASGDAGNGIGCDHGAFGDMRILGDTEFVCVALELTPSQVFLGVGEELQLSAICRDDEGIPDDVSATAEYSVTPADIVSVSDTGLVTGLTPGVVEITATSGEFTATSTIEVANILSLADMVANGDGTGPGGSLDSEFAGINLDTGAFMSYTELSGANAAVNDVDGFNPSPVDGSDLVESVFILNSGVLPITLDAIDVLWEVGDENAAGSYNHILSNLTHRIDQGNTEITTGGRNDWATAIGVHASAGVTFDLTAIRAEHGDEAVKELSVSMGVDLCEANANLSLMIIYTDGNEVLIDDAAEDLNPIPKDYVRVTATGTELYEYRADIPADATHLTLAVGANGNGIGCDHGVFANPVIIGEGGDQPGLVFRRGDPDNTGGGNITDAISVLNHLFAGADRPVCWAAADANGDGGVNVSDPVYQLNFLFGGGDPTLPPGPGDCGPGTAADEALGCDEYTSC